MPGQTAVILGATGLTGSLLLDLLLDDDRFDTVRVLTRRPLQRQHPKLEIKLVNFEDLEDYAFKMLNGDVIFCCIGTTRKKVQGDMQAYRKVDFDIPFNAARLGAGLGFTQYVLISAIGADSSASNFYLQLKGEVEKNIRLFDFEGLHIFRPSLLLGDRAEKRSGERLMRVLFAPLSLLLFGRFRKYKAIHARTLARAMRQVAVEKTKGVHVYEYDEIKSIS